MAKTVFSGFVIACRRAICPTRRSPLSVKATTEGVMRLPSAFVMTTGSPASMMATPEVVAPALRVRDGALQIVDDREQVPEHALVGELHGLGALARGALLQVLQVGALAQPALVALPRLLARLLELGLQGREAGGDIFARLGRALRNVSLGAALVRHVRCIALSGPGVARDQNPVCQACSVAPWGIGRKGVGAAPCLVNSRPPRSCSVPAPTASRTASSPSSPSSTGRSPGSPRERRTRGAGSRARSSPSF